MPWRIWDIRKVLLRGLLLAGAVLCCAVPGAVWADDGVFHPPEGCTGYLTVQMRGCEVSHFWTCEGDPNGHRWDLSIDIDGPSQLGRIDAEAQWIETIDLAPLERRTLDLPATDPHNLTELLEAGVDTFDFTQTTDAGAKIGAKGYDRLTGATVTIDGEQLLETDVSAVFTEDGEEVVSVVGREYVSAKHRRFFAGTYEVSARGGTFTRDNTPIDFIYPGEPGFFASKPQYDCDASLARFVPPVKGTEK